MKSVLVKSTLLGMFAATTLLVGCGGGGGGGSFTPPEISNTPVTIDSTNQYQVADAADNGVNGAVNGTPGVLGVVINGGGSTFNAFDFAQSSLQQYAGQVVASGQAIPAGFSADTPCDTAPDGSTGSNTVSTNVNIETVTVASAGDYLSMSFSNCYDSADGTTTNGSMKFTMVQGGLDLSAFSLIGLTEISANFNNLRVTEGGETNVVHGGFNISTDGTTESLTGTSLYVMKVGGEAAHLTDFTITNSTANTLTDTISVSMTIASTDINGVITVATDPSNPLVQDISEQHPHSGILFITGSTSKLTMTIIDATNVTLELDSNGDDVVDATANVTWTEIDNGAAAVL